MAAIQQSSGEGALYELAARGKKDAFFLEDKPGSVYPYYSFDETAIPYITERRIVVPKTEPGFGATFEIELDTFGDLVTECNLLINLPTWLPDNMVIVSGQQPTTASRVNNYYHIKSSVADVSYGYVNYPGYFLFSKIQFYQDQFLIQEWSGDSLFATSATEGSWNSVFMDQVAAGFVQDDKESRGVALRATPDTLRLKLPIPGVQARGDSGFPICCSPDQKFRFRIQLRKLEELVVSSDKAVRPEPWNVPSFKYVAENSSGVGTTLIEVVPKSRDEIGAPSILLEMVQAYIPEQIKKRLISMHMKIPFKKHFENIHTFGPSDYDPIHGGGTSVVTRRLEGRHPAERVVFFFRSENSILTNYLDDFTDPSGTNVMNSTGGGQFYKKMKFLIAGVDREREWDAFVFQDINAYAKDVRDSGFNIGEMRWDLGDVWEREKPSKIKQPEGAINFTNADRPTLRIALEPVPKGSSVPRSEMHVIIDSWNVYEFNDGRGRLMFSN